MTACKSIAPSSPVIPALTATFSRWTVARYGHKTAPGSDRARWTLTLERTSAQRPMRELALIPTPATVDLYRLYEDLDIRMKERAAIAHARLDSYTRRERLKQARDQWQRIRMFREDYQVWKQKELALAAEAARPRDVRSRVSSKMREKKESIKEFVATARKRSRQPGVTRATSLPDIKFYPGTWQTKTMLNAV